MVWSLFSAQIHHWAIDQLVGKTKTSALRHVWSKESFKTTMQSWQRPGWLAGFAALRALRVWAMDIGYVCPLVHRSWKGVEKSRQKWRRCDSRKGKQSVKFVARAKKHYICKVYTTTLSNDMSRCWATCFALQKRHGVARIDIWGSTSRLSLDKRSKFPSKTVLH